MDRPERRQIRRLGPLHGLRRAAAFEEGNQRKDVVEILAGDFGDVATATRLQFDQAFRGKHFQGFAQGRARDAILLGQLLFVDPGAWRQFVGVDALSQTFGDFLVKRGGSDAVHCLESCEPDRPVHRRLASVIMDKVLCRADHVKLGPESVEF
ncbi:hypothetical protein SDC9_200055 [bioreactor metagenome]|uniref:Uncharacterized protein n=1 Tax=bioreactor metagenome TaxID=1076179 RepID=A0A645IVG8_9ZZZZ